MHSALNRLFVSIVTLASIASSVSFAGEVSHPYGCPEIKTNDGVRWTYNYQSSCSLRQAPEKIWDCKKNVEAKEAPYFSNIEKQLEKNCYNINGYLRVTTCVDSHTWETEGPHAYWSYQTAKAFLCYYK